MLALVHLIAKTSNVLEKDRKTKCLQDVIAIKNNVLVRLISLKSKEAEKDLGC